MTADRHHFEVLSSQQRFAGAVFDVRTDAVRMPDGTVADRDIISHPGAVAVLALDADDQVVMVRQYRSGTSCWSCRPACSTSTASRRWKARAASCSRRRR